MKKKHLSIGNRLSKVKNYQTQQKILSEWAANWQTDQQNVIKRLRSAAMIDNHCEIMHIIDQLQGLTDKRFDALNNTLRTLSDPDRILKDLRSVKDNVSSDSLPTIFPEDKTPKQQDPIKNDDLMVEMVKSYNAGMSTKEMAAYSGMEMHKVIKILVTAGVYSGETYDRIKEFRECGMSDTEIADRLGIKKSTMNIYTPYKKGIYNLNTDSASKNALRIRKHREQGKIT